MRGPSDWSSGVGQAVAKAAECCVVSNVNESRVCGALQEFQCRAPGEAVAKAAECCVVSNERAAKMGSWTFAEMVARALREKIGIQNPL